MRRRVLMIKTVVGFAYLLILALLGFLALVGGVVMLVRLIRRLGSMNQDDLERLARQSPKRLPKKEKPTRPS
jgi:Trk-type K+ transport system membrane component